MGAVYFYHLTRSPLDATLAHLLGRACDAGWRSLLRGTARERLEDLDAALWTLGGDDAFVPHALAGAAQDSDQPVLLTTDPAPDPGRQCVMCIDGAALAAEEVAGLERACILFDGNDEAAVAAARLQWKALTRAGCAAKYWSEESGRWEMKAEAGAT